MIEQGSEQSEPKRTAAGDSRPEMCQEILALTPAYSLGATDAPEAARVEAGLASCPEAAAALAEYRALAEALLFSPPPTAAPPHLAQALQATLQVEQQPAGPVTAQGEPSGSPSPIARLRRLLFPWELADGYVWAGVALLLLLATNLYWSAQVNTLLEQQGQLTSRLALQTAVLRTLLQDNATQFQLAAADPADQAPAASARVLWNPNATSGLLLAENFPPLAADMAYQLWLVEGDRRISGGLFQVDSSGSGLLIIQADQPLANFERMGITAEPATGSPGPTGPAVVRGSL